MSVLTFKSVTVRRMPGIIDGGFTLESLAGGVNIVFGPNASGKTTTARTVEALLWPKAAAPREAWLEGRFEVDGAAWWVEVDAGRSRWQLEGGEVSGPPVSPPEDRDRYRLSLHELLRADDAGFARSIMLESAGGYDLSAAARILAPRLTLSRPRREIDELRAAKQKLLAARAVQEALYQQSLSLEPDEATLAERPAIEARQALLTLALEHDARSEEARQLKGRLERFHPVVARLHGKEAETVAGLRTALREAEAAARKAEFDVQRLAGDIVALDLPAEALERERLSALAGEVAELEVVHREMRAEDRRAAEEKTRLDAELRRLGPALSHEQLGSIQADDVEEISAVARSLHEARSDRAAHEAELRVLGPAVSTGDRGRLDRGAFLLQQWLRQGRAVSGPAPERRLALAGAILLIVAGAALSLLHLGALAAAVAGAAILLLLPRSRDEGDPRQATEAEFSALQLAASPARWGVEEVRAVLDLISEQLTVLRAEESRNERRQRLATSLQDVGAREESLRGRAGALADRLGIDAAHDEFRLVWTVEAIGRWQKAEDDLAAAVEARNRAWEQESDILARANQRLSEAGIEPATTPQLLKARIEELQTRVQTHQELTGRHAAAARAAELARQRQTEVEAQIDELFARLELRVAEEPRLADWCAERVHFVAFEAKHRAVENELERLRGRISEVEDDLDTLLGRSRASLEDEVKELSARLDELSAVGIRVIQLKRDIENAKRGHDIEDALAEVERAAAALRAARTRDISSAISHALVAHVERTSRDQHLPAVFHRASSIFARITHGRYTLRLDDTGSGAFRAYDTTSERSHALEELSSATRLQLLLAVRVAFIELQERGLRLPILMDETLANSDDDRASAIMDAVLELADNGRQIFYFTAQPDEVRKWSAAMARRPSLEGRVIDLGAERRLERRLPPEALSVVEDSSPKYPSPGFLTHAAYASLLHVPPVDVFAPVGSLHLWYLIEDPDALYRVLQTLRTECWGQLDALAEYGGARLLGESFFDRLEVGAEAAAVALSRLKVGRGLPVDRQTLLASGAVTERFLDEVARVAAEMGGDARKLLTALGNRAVSGFRVANIDVLSSYLEENGYVDERDPIASDTIRLEVIAALASALQQDLITVPDLDRLLNRIFAGARAPQLSGSALPQVSLQNLASEDVLLDDGPGSGAESAAEEGLAEAAAPELLEREELPADPASDLPGEAAAEQEAQEASTSGDVEVPLEGLLSELLPQPAAGSPTTAPDRALGSSRATLRKREPVDYSHELKLL